MNLKDLMNKVQKIELMEQRRSTAKPFDDLERFCKEGAPAITQIIVRRGMIVDSVSFVCNQTVFSHGGNGGSEYRHALAKDETIVKVECWQAPFCSKIRVADIAFTTSTGRKLTFGSPRKEKPNFSHTAKEGRVLCCMFGNADNFVDYLGFYEIETPKPSMPSMPHKPSMPPKPSMPHKK